MRELKNRPNVSVIISTYNRSHLVCQAIKSVLNQTYQNYEVIIVDDASTDNTENIVKSFNDSRIKYMRHKENKGGSAARNTGIKSAQGDFIAFLDDDDEWLSNKLEKQMERFDISPENVGIVYCGFFYIFNRQFIEKIVPIFKGDIFHETLIRCTMGGSTPLIKKSCFYKSGFFDETLPSCQDWDMWIRITQFYDAEFVPCSLVKHIIHGDQISTAIVNKIVAREIIMNKYNIELSKRKKILSWHLRRLGSLCCLDGKYFDSFKYLLRSIMANPFNGGSYVHLLLFLMSKRLHKEMIIRYGLRKIGDITLIY